MKFFFVSSGNVKEHIVAKSHSDAALKVIQKSSEQDEAEYGLVTHVGTKGFDAPLHDSDMIFDTASLLDKLGISHT